MFPNITFGGGLSAGGGTSGDISSGPVGVGGISSPISIGGFKADAQSLMSTVPPWVWIAGIGLGLLWLIRR